MNTSRCIFEEVGHWDITFQVLSGIYGTLAFATIVVSLVLWYLLQEKHIYLKKRGMTMAVLVALGWTFNLLAGPVPRTNNDEGFFLHQCPVLNMNAVLATPTIILATVTRVVLFRNRARLQKLLAETSLEEYDAARKKLNRAWFFASDFYLYLVAAGAFAVLAAAAFAVTYQLCPELGGNECLIADNNDIRFTSFFFVACMTAVFVFIYVSRTLKTFPDPFNILGEIRKGTSLAMAFALVSVIFSTLNLGEPAEQDVVYFSYGVLIDLAIAVAGVYLLPFQIYKSGKFNEFKAVYSDMSMDKVLKDPTGRALLKAHLVNEFSVENLNFIEEVEKFRELGDGAEKQQKAQAIFDQFIAASRLNIGVETQRIQQLFETGGGQVGGDIFNEAFDLVWDLVESDPFRRFQGTETYMEYAGVNPRASLRSKRASIASSVL